MKLARLLNALDKKEFSGDESREIVSIAIHSKNAGPQSLFVAIPGLKSDGHAFIDEAYRAGARAFVTRKNLNRPGISNITVPDTRSALAELAAEFYGHPTKNMKLIGITGTNGKTSTAFLVESILNEAGCSTGLLSTIEYRFKSHARNAERTTPGAVELQGILREMADAGTKYVVMEVSSHGLKQGRVESCHFDVGIFTNLSPEHLDYHGTMDDYYRTKERFFKELLKKSCKQNVGAVINRDEAVSRLLLKGTPSQTITYGLKSGDVHAGSFQIYPTEMKAEIFTKNESFEVTSKLVGKFNLYNILAAVAAARLLKISTEAIKAGIEKAKGVPGRMERIENDRGILVFVDYAHTGDALENVLKTLKSCAARNIITVFGCGGDRDRQKRPVMGRIAADYSAVVILTSDNPRGEQPEQIIREIEKGVLKKGFVKAEYGVALHSREKRYFVFEDRRTAIRNAILLAEPDDVVLIAGKGHETYQQTGNKKIHFDDREEVRRAFKMCA